MEVYLDNSATTRPCEQAIAAMTTAMREQYYNPSALYAPALHVEKELVMARKTLAERAGLGEKSVIFTSGGTESNNLAILGYMAGQRREAEVLYSAAEHPAVKNACVEAAALRGQTAREIPLTATGSLDLAALEAMLTEKTALICVMQVCNETGVVMPLADVAALRDRLAPRAAFHVDGVQGYLRIPFSLRAAGVQSYAVSGHKVHGPKGIGALITQEGHRLRPILVGGGQEGNLRSGTENTVGIAGFRAAVESFPETQQVDAQLRELKAQLVQGLKAAIPEMLVVGEPLESAASAGHILSVAFPPVRGETLVHALEAEGVLIGTGSACSSKKGKRSAVLTAMRVPPGQIDATVRMSLSHQNTQEEIACVVEKTAKHYALLQKYQRR